MKKVYLLNYASLTRAEMELLVDNSPLIKTWRYDLPNMFYIASENSAQEIATDIRDRYGKDFRFLVIEVNANNKYGWLPKTSWKLLNTGEI